MSYIEKDLTAEDCLKIQQTIIQWWNSTEIDFCSICGPDSNDPDVYKTPCGALEVEESWIEDEENNSWLLQLNTGMIEITVYIFYFEGKVYPIKSEYGKATVYEPLSYGNDIERSKVEKAVFFASQALGWMIKF